MVGLLLLPLGFAGNLGEWVRRSGAAPRACWPPLVATKQPRTPRDGPARRARLTAGTMGTPVCTSASDSQPRWRVRRRTRRACASLHPHRPPLRCQYCRLEQAAAASSLLTVAASGAGSTEGRWRTGGLLELRYRAAAADLFPAWRGPQRHPTSGPAVTSLRSMLELEGCPQGLVTPLRTTQPLC